MTCFPCWPNSASATLASDDKIIPGNVTEPQKEQLQNNNDDLGRPTKGEYARETGKKFLEVLDIAAKQIPVPGVESVIEVVKSLVQMCEDSYATLKNADELKNRIKHLTLVLVDELKGKKVEEIEERLRNDIKQLERDLKFIQSKLNEIATQNAILVILFRRLNEDKVQECVGRLGNALESFHFSRQIADADALEHLTQQIDTFFRQAVQELQESNKRIEQGIADVRAILDKRNQGDELNGSKPRRGVIPVAPEIFFGRDAIVDDFVRTLVSQKTTMARICLLGPGGMGKTSIARTVLNHSSVIAHFGRENRVWVPCVKATSVSLLKDTLYESLGLSLNTGDPLNDILYDLNSSKSPIILLLDNFETPWNLHDQADVQDILFQLEKLEHVALFVTMRSFQPPGDSIQWESVHLKAVDKEFSIRIYAEIDPTGSQRPELPSLLDEVGHMPLAITLLAKLGKKLDSSPAELLEQYQKGGTALLNLGGSAERNMDIFIGLSVQSLPMMDSPSAAKLLAKALSRWWVRDLVPDATIMSGLGTLLDTSLVEKRADTYVVLPVIRRYILHPDRFPENIRESTVRMACAFLKEHNASVGTSNYLAHKTARSLEEANLQGILLETTAPDPDILEALLILSEHQYETRPRLEVVQHALELSMESEDKKWYAEALYWNGQNLKGLAQYEEAIKQFHLGRAAFLQVSEPKRAADALYWAGQISVSTRSPNHQDVQKALAEYQSLDDPAGIAKCQMSPLLASTSNAQSILTLTTTWEFCVSHKLLVEQTLCSYYITQTCINFGRFDEAQKWGLISLDESRRVIGEPDHARLRLVGQLSISLGEYDKAVEYLMEGLERSKAYGSPLGMVGILFQLGRVWMKKGQKEDAKGAFTETLKYCELLQGSWEGPQNQRACRFYLDKLENPSREPDWQEREALMQLGAKEDYETVSIAESDGGSDTSSGE
ncbi:hypothetical protein BDP27DRAFT_1322241 [Rhodocollybia butyracea]|uniref:NB-ARC domain-containing protein n=1 Tax=Rhodocollybia butyracea TaxID=206335 RepID=A0A9P5U9Z7_9AGAR|nr:hypothetical protein BDP27DRAFT_1322241 [Rhodocollybia butyracea]